MDLFEHYEKLPIEVQSVLNKYAELDNTYENCQAMQDELEVLGYTFDWGLDAEPYNLRKMSVIDVTKTLRALYLYYFNSGFTVGRFSEHYNLDINDGYLIIEMGKKYHERHVEFEKSKLNKNGL